MQDGEKDGLYSLKGLITKIAYSLPDLYAFSVRTLALYRKTLCDKVRIADTRFPLNFV
jgi:hypothetical protein